MTTIDTGQATKKGLLSGLLGGGRTIFVFALVAALVAVAATAQLLGNATATTTYYVLSQSVAARTPITPDMLAPVKVGVNSAPPDALTPADVQPGDKFALVPLKRGDVLSTSTVGALTRINSNLPANFVVASFSVTAANAVAGKLRSGDYIDVIAQSTTPNDTEIAKVVLHHVLVLDVTTDPSNITDSATSGDVGDVIPGPESEQAHSGIPQLYTVGVTPEDAVTLALVRDKNLMVVLSSNDSTGDLDANNNTGNIFNSNPVADSGKGTENAADGGN